MNTLRILRDCLPEGIDPNTVTSETTYLSLGLDSLDFIVYINDVETALGIERIPTPALKELKTLGDVEAYILALSSTVSTG
jgi:acyl carrier protein